MKKEPPINLAKCKIGQRVRLRNGEVRCLKEIDEGNCVMPFFVGGEWYMKHGYFWDTGATHHLDIVAILPLPKKKAKTAKASNLTETAKLVFRLKGAMNVVNGLVKELEASL